MKINLTIVQQNLLDDVVILISDVESLSKEKIVYWMVQIRKILEISNLEKDAKFMTLTFFIDWSLHPRKTRNSYWFNTIKKKVELDIRESEEILQDKEIDRIIDPKVFWHDEFLKLVSLQSLRNDLESFAVEYCMDFETLFVPKNWNTFRDFVMKVLADAPIEITDPDCPISSIIIHSDKNKTKFKQEEGLAKHVCDYVLINRDESFDTVSFLDGTMPIGARDASKLNSKI